MFAMERMFYLVLEFGNVYHRGNVLSGSGIQQCLPYRECFIWLWNLAVFAMKRMFYFGCGIWQCLPWKECFIWLWNLAVFAMEKMFYLVLEFGSV
jgi:hypothetical protein